MYLITGDAQVTIAASYRMSPTTVGRIIAETCSAIWTIWVEKEYLKVPSTEVEWKKIASAFEHKWNFPNTIGNL